MTRRKEARTRQSRVVHPCYAAAAAAAVPSEPEDSHESGCWDALRPCVFAATAGHGTDLRLTAAGPTQSPGNGRSSGAVRGSAPAGSRG